MFSIKRHIEDEQSLLALAKKLSCTIEANMVIYLEGNLGAGKTVFARGVINAMGYSGLVKSPTYSLVEQYVINNDITCYHFDLYRLAEPEELEFTGARDYFNQQSVCLVEWPEKALGFIPTADIHCLIEYHDDGRKVTVSAHSPLGNNVMLAAFPNESL